jgi:UTRA domain
MLLVSGRLAVRIRSPALGFRTIIPTSCLPRARSVRLRGLLGLCQFGPSSLSHRIGQGALSLIRRVQINQRGALAVVPHPDHKFPGIRARIGRRYTSNDPRSGNLLSASVSYMPKALVEANPAILDERNEPWPGGTLHQLSTVGIEIMKVVDEVTARMPSSTEAQEWDLPPGIPLLFCRRLSYDREGALIEISDAWYPADRTELRFVTPLKPRPDRSKGRQN